MPPQGVNRKFDLAAFAAIVETVEAKGSLDLEFPTRKGCEALRMQFYRWRSQEQELNADPSFLSGIVVRITGGAEGGRITFSSGLANPDLRDALDRAGVQIDAIPEEGEA